MIDPEFQVVGVTASEDLELIAEEGVFLLDEESLRSEDEFYYEGILKKENNLLKLENKKLQRKQCVEIMKLFFNSGVRRCLKKGRPTQSDTEHTRVRSLEVRNENLRKQQQYLLTRLTKLRRRELCCKVESAKAIHRISRDRFMVARTSRVSHSTRPGRQWVRGHFQSSLNG